MRTILGVLCVVLCAQVDVGWLELEGVCRKKKASIRHILELRWFSFHNDRILLQIFSSQNM